MKYHALISCFLMLQSMVMYAQWQYEGSPEMGTPVDISSDGDTTLVCTMTSLFYATGADFKWQEIPVPADALMIRDIEYQSGMIYLAALTCVDHFNFSFFRSFDLGQSWQNNTPYENFRGLVPVIIPLGDTLLLFDQDSVSISFDRGTSYEVYPGKFRQITYHDGFLYNNDFITYRSSDLGISWEPLAFNPGFLTKDLASINGVLYKSDYQTTGSNDSAYVYRSDDHGDTWTHLVTVDDYSFPKLIGDEHGIYLTNEYRDDHVWYTTDEMTWIKKSNPENSYDPEMADGALLFRHYNGLFATDSLVENIRQVNEGFTAGSILSFAHFQDQVWVNSNLKTFSDDPASQKWNDVPGLYSVTAREDGFLVGGKDGNLYRSEDGGNTWIQIPPENFDVPEAVNFNRLIAAGNYFFALSEHYTWSSDNNGYSWSSFTPRTSLVDYDGIYAASTKRGDVSISADGDQWMKANYDLPLFSHESVYAIDIHNGYFFLFSGEGTFRLPPLTTSWEMINAPASPAIILPLLGDNLSVTSNDDYIITGIYGRGVFISKDNGDTWIEANEGLGNKFVLSTEIIGDDVYVGTEKGVWRRPLAEFQTVSTNVAPDIDTYTVSPVPSSGVVTIRAKNKMELTPARVSLYDANGRIIPASVSVNENSIVIDITEIPTGLFFARIYNEGEIGIVKVVKK